MDVPARVSLATLGVEDVARSTAFYQELVKPPAATGWGGYSGYFSDPDGHLWEVAHNPAWPIGPDGRPTLPSQD